MYLIEWKGKKKSNIRQREMKSYWIVIIISVYHKRVLLTKLYSKRKQAAYICLSAFCLFSHETSFLSASGKKIRGTCTCFFWESTGSKLSRFFIASGLHWITTISEPRLISFPLLHIIFLNFCPISFRQLLHLFNIFDEIYELKKLCENSCELP